MKASKDIMPVEVHNVVHQNYTMISNEAIWAIVNSNDIRNRGDVLLLYTHMRSKREHYRFYPAVIAKQLKWSVTKVKKNLALLVKCGLLKIVQQHDSKGAFLPAEYIVFWTPSDSIYFSNPNEAEHSTVKDMPLLIPREYDCIFTDLDIVDAIEDSLTLLSEENTVYLQFVIAKFHLNYLQLLKDTYYAVSDHKSNIRDLVPYTKQTLISNIKSLKRRVPVALMKSKEAE